MNNNIEEKKCLICGNTERTLLRIEDTDNYICADCLENSDEYSQCDDCHNVFKNDDLTRTGDDDFVCSDCLENDYFYCDCCEKYYSINEGNYIEDTEEDVCDNCRDEKYYYCSDCDCLYSESRVRETAYGNYVCDSCIDDHYSHCEDCGRLFNDNELYYNDDDDCYYCSDCEESRERNRESSGVLSYHAFSNWEFKKLEKETEPKLFFGFELETEPKNCSYDRDETAEFIHKNIDVVLETDGSLNSGGIEIISHPATFEYIMANKEKLEKTFNGLANDYNYCSHDSRNCGLHIHVTRPKEIEIIDRIWLVIETYKEQFIKFARRTGNHYCQYMSDNDSSLNASFYKIKKNKNNSSRYMALNTCLDSSNSKTIEFRMFKGTLNIDTFLATIELVNNIVTLCSDLTINLKDITWTKLTSTEYAKKYCDLKDIHTDRIMIDDIIKFELLNNTIEYYKKMINNEFYKIVTLEDFTRPNFVKCKNKLDTISKYSTYLYDISSNLRRTKEKIDEITNILDYANNSKDFESLKNVLKNYYFSYDDCRNIIKNIVKKMEKREKTILKGE